MKIRKAAEKDIPDLVCLMEELGYPTSLENMTKRFKDIESNPSYYTLVADYDGKVVGLAGLCTSIYYEFDGSYVRIVAFVVDANYRRKGIGKKLIQNAETWAKEQGAISIALNTGNREERKDAHQFYLSMGYNAKSIGFVKSIN